MGGREFYSNVNGVEEINKNLEKMNEDGKRNYNVSLIAAIASVLSLGVAVYVLFKS